jgi:hypothetical protein
MRPIVFFVLLGGKNSLPGGKNKKNRPSGRIKPNGLSENAAFGERRAKNGVRQIEIL